MADNSLKRYKKYYRGRWLPAGGKKLKGLSMLLTVTLWQKAKEIP